MMQSYSWNMGWTCPKCQKAYSPITPECYTCNNQHTTVTTGTTTEIKYANPHIDIWVTYTSPDTYGPNGICRTANIYKEKVLDGIKFRLVVD